MILKKSKSTLFGIYSGAFGFNGNCPSWAGVQHLVLMLLYWFLSLHPLICPLSGFSRVWIRIKQRGARGGEHFCRFTRNFVLFYNLQFVKKGQIYNIWPKSTSLAQTSKIQSTNLQNFGHKKCNVQAFQVEYTVYR